MTLLLGIDVGTTGVKAALFTPDGHLQAARTVEYPTHHLRPGWVEQNPNDWWTATCAAIRAALADVPDAPARVIGLAVSSQAPSMVALDSAGEPVRPALIWMDRRAETETAQLVEHFGWDEIIRITGNRPDPYYVASKIKWFHQREPQDFRRARWFAQIPGYINLRLTGELTLDDVHRGLMGLWDRTSGGWSTALCEACGLTPDQIPPVYPGHHRQGAVTPAAAEATGLRAGTPVMVGTVDGAAAAVEAGVAEEGLVAEMTGTSTVLLIPNTSGISEPAFIAMPHALPGMHLLVGAMVSSGASLNWYRDQFGRWEIEEARRTESDVFDLLTREASTAAPGSEGVLFLPYMMGERAPIWHTQARGVLFGLSLATPRGAVIRAILEGTAFALRHNIEVAAEVGARLTELRGVGGPTRSPLWCQIIADATNQPLTVLKDNPGAPLGDVFLAAAAVGLIPDAGEAAARAAQVERVYTPDPAHRAVYDARFAVYRILYPALKPAFDTAAAG
ncbi:MAG: carbohydrate kinase [Anaerolineae bacterium]|nr:carbohydrate kinase [Anaerolineae bacterium]